MGPRSFVSMRSVCDMLSAHFWQCSMRLFFCLIVDGVPRVGGGRGEGWREQRGRV